jgi:SAM-dependent methyltransferase
MDRGPVFAYQVLLWIQTLTAKGGVAPSQIIVHHLEDCDSEVLQSFAAMGVGLQKVSRFDEGHAHSNKVRQMETPALREADYCVLLDCDMAFTKGLEHFATGERVRAKIVDDNGIGELWKDIFLEAGLSAVEQSEVSSSTLVATPPNYCNGGLYIIPKPLFAKLGEFWPKWTKWVIAHHSMVGANSFFTDQISFCLAITELGEKVDLLPMEYNCPTHLAADEIEVSEPPVVLHYHGQLDDSGFLIATGNAVVDESIAATNGFISTERQKSFDNRIYWNYRYVKNPALGSGLGSRGENLALKSRIVSEQVEKLKPASILDIGCGDLEVSQLISSDNYTGVDISLEAINIAKKKRPEWHFECGDILKLDLPQSDMVICLDVLIHQPNFEKYEALCKRLLCLTGKYLLVAGNNSGPLDSSNVFFYYEPLSTTLQRLESGKIETLAEYREATLLRWSRPGVQTGLKAKLKALLGKR